MAELSRKSFLSIAGLLLLQVGISGASAAVGPSLKPTKVGQTIIWRGKKYTALKSGKKIIWNKGVALPTPKATSSPSPSATPPPSASPTPTPTPTQTAVAVNSFEIDLAASSDVPNGETRIFYPSDSRAKGKGFIITRDKGRLIAFDVNCTHETCPVELEGPKLICNCHNSIFNKITGAPETGPASEPLRNYPVREALGRIILTDSNSSTA